MPNDTNNKAPKVERFNFADFMSPKGSDSLDNLFGTLSDMGVPVSITGKEFCANEDALLDADQLSHNLVFYGKWLIAKVAAFEALRDIGFDAVKAAADRREIIDVAYEFGDGSFKGEWCRMHGVIYASFGGLIEVASASEARNKRERESADLDTARFLLSALFSHTRGDTKAA
tara:strand:- start:125073 stop:125591 length:519 start_codon:yes stop_codon:yes gene_type:complete